MEALNKEQQSRCAIKIVRSLREFREDAKAELRVLSTLAANDKHNKNKCVHFRECFDFRGHICIVTDLYGQSFYSFLSANNYVPFPGSQIQNFARQLFISIACRLVPRPVDFSR